MKEELLRLLDGPDGPACEGATAALANAVGDDEVYTRVEALYERRPKERHRYFQIRCRIRPETANPWLDRALRSKAPRLVTRACYTCWEDALTPPLDASIAAIRAGRWAEGWAGRDLIAALALKHGDAGRQALEELLRTGTPQQPLTAALGLATEQHPGALEILKEEVLKPRRPPRGAWRVSKAIGYYYPEEMRRWFQNEADLLLREPGAAWTVARSNQQVSERVLQKLYRDGTPAVQAAALQAMARSKRAGALGELRRALRNGRPKNLARVAFKELLRLRPDSEALVTEMPASKHWTERKAAAGILRRWGTLSDADLAKLSADPHVAVRAGAVR